MYLKRIILSFLISINFFYGKDLLANTKHHKKDIIDSLLISEFNLKRDAYDFTHYLMVPMINAYLIRNRQRVYAFRDFFQKFEKVKSFELSRLTELQFLYFISWYLVLEKLQYRYSNLKLEYLVYRNFNKIWNEPAWHWTICGVKKFKNMGERIIYKLSNKKTPKSYCKAIIDEELFSFGVAANLRYLGWNTKSIKRNLELAKLVFDKKVKRDRSNKFLFQPDVWEDHPDYKYACYNRILKGKPKICKGITTDSSHSHRLPLLFLSLKIASEDKRRRNYYDDLLKDLKNQFFEKILVLPTKDFLNYRIKNFMDGRNGYFRVRYKTVPTGYAPYELSGILLLGWYSFLPGNDINKIYCSIANNFPFSQEEINLYKDKSKRKKHFIIENAFNNGLIEAIVRSACFINKNKLYAEKSNTNDIIYPFTPFVNAHKYIKKKKRLSFDEKGIPYFNYGKQYKAGRYYNPGFIATYAQALYRDYIISKDKRIKDEFLKIVNWIIKTAKERNYKGKKFLVWEYEFNINKFLAKAPWISAYAQGKILPVLIYAYEITGSNKYKNYANQVFNSFAVEMKKEGVSTFIGNDIAFYEEVAKENIPSAKILNGHIFALAGLYTYLKYTGEETAYDLVLKGYNGILNYLGNYDLGFISRYSLYPCDKPIIAPVKGYNFLHIHQLLWLNKINSNSKLLYYALKFSSYENTGFKYSANTSIDPENHGPENLRIYMGVKYWSASKFPAKIEVNFNNKLMIKSINIVKYTENTKPRQIAINIFNQKKKVRVRFIKIENRRFIKYLIDKPVLADNIEISLLNHLSYAKLVALYGIGLEVIKPNPVAISNFESFSSSNNPVYLFQKKFKIKSSDFILIDKGVCNNISLVFEKQEGNIFIESRDSFLYTFNNKFYKISLKEKEINLPIKGRYLLIYYDGPVQKIIAKCKRDKI